MSILIVGSEGSQGKRYQSILRFLRKDYLCRDLNRYQISTDNIWGKVDGFIITTPTDTHVDIIRKLLPYGKPILCEKPITKDVELLPDLFLEAMQANVPLSMIMQYRHLTQSLKSAYSFYDYFKHGSDGLIWDCLQIIGLAKGTIELFEKSPIWNCQINGDSLDIGLMDAAYVTEIDYWLKKDSVTPSQILEIHQKVRAFENHVH